MNKAVEYFGGDELPASVFIDKYALRDGDEILEETPDDMHWRMAREFARIEKKKFSHPYSAEFIYECFKDFSKIIPQGSLMSGIGSKSYVTLSNCFAAGTQVFTLDGVKNIESVQIGDQVVTHKGNIKPVTQLHKNLLGDRQIYSIKCYRTPVFSVTGNHKVMSISKEQYDWGEKPTWNEIQYLRVGDFVAIPKRNDNIAPDDFNISNIPYDGERYLVVSDGDKIQMETVWDHNRGRTRKHREVNKIWRVDNDFARFLGLWYGDGCVFSSVSDITSQRNRTCKSVSSVRGITFTINAKEDDVIKFISEYGEKLFGIGPDMNDNREIDGSYQIVFHSTIIGLAFEHFFGRRCNGKVFHPSIYKWNRSLVESLVIGLIESDGTVTSTGDLRVVLNNHPLIESFYHLMRSHGWVVGCVKGFGKHKYARLDFSNRSEFISKCKRTYGDDRMSIVDTKEESKVKRLEIDDVSFVRIDEKNKINFSDEYVYTLGVEDDHSYAVEGVISLNCYVVAPPLDSYASIHNTDEQITAISKRRGGVGTDMSHIRPSSMPTKNAARTATGVVPFCERFSNTIREVGQSGRRGALLESICVHHPQIIDFAEMKLDNTKVTGANVSVRLSDEFLKAVENDTEYEQRWPVTGKKKISKMVRARDVWERIVHCAWLRAEPGLLFWDRILSESPADCYASFGFLTVCVNPCAEIPINTLDSCRLLLLNLFGFVENPFRSNAKFNFSQFYDYCKLAQRLMDNVIDLEIEMVERIIKKIDSDPEPEEIKCREREVWKTVLGNCNNGRRTGTGLTALGDAIAAIGISYGSDESIEFTELIYRIMKFACYQSSVDMAKQIGPFPIWDHELEKKCPFLNRFKDENILIDGLELSGKDLFEEMKKYGRRNIALLTTAPAGSVSIMAGPRQYWGTTSGIEPLFTDEPYTRRKKITPGMKNARVDFVDEMGDQWTNYQVFHSKIKMWMDITGETDWKKSPYHGCTANDIDWKQRVKLQAIAGKHLCHSLSSTVNLPSDVTEEKVAEIYETAWKAGCKGITVYRDGCRSGVLIKNEPVAAATVTKNNAPKRPAEVVCDIHKVTIKGDQLAVLVGILNGEPYEVFAFTNSEKLPKTGKLKKLKRGHYELLDENGETLVKDVSSLLSENEEALTRMTSTSLRHGADTTFIVDQLSKVKGDMHSFAKALSRALKKYVKDGTKATGTTCSKCGSDSVIYQEGCHLCKNCGESKCG